ncbi:MAG: transposase [Acidobacteria bacterium]|nr:transposase [Acidobacteriota bacterium]
MDSQKVATQATLSWPHSPVHWLNDAGTYIVTAATRRKEHLFRSAERLNYLTNALITLSEEYGWRLQAWAIFSNHYHFVAASQTPKTLRRLIQYLHSVSAKHINLHDGQPGRNVWFQYWDTRLTNEKSYFARLNYVHSNAVKHGLVKRAETYPWCSAGWFAMRASRPFYETVRRFPCDRVSVPDEFDVCPTLNVECGSRAPAFDTSNSKKPATAAARLPHSTRLPG